MILRALSASALAAVAALASPLHADVVDITVTGEVEYNQIGPAPLGNPGPGNAASISFQVDSDVFVDSGSFPTRGYAIDTSSFTLTMDATSIGLQSPFPAGQTAYFVLRDNDPAVDGFYISTDVDGPIGVPLAQTGSFGQFRNNFYVTYGGGTLSSLDILDATGSYDFTGLSVFNWTVDDGPFNAMGLIFAELTISAADSPWEDLGGGTSGVNGVPTLVGSGPLTGGSLLTLALTDGPPSEFILLWIGTSSSPVNVLGGTVHAVPFDFEVLLATNTAGAFVGADSLPAVVPSGADLYFQYICQDLTTLFNLTLSNAVHGVTP